MYDGYTFEGNFGGVGGDNDSQDIELKPDGANIQLTRSNADEFIKLYLKKLTELENLQFERVFLGI